MTECPHPSESLVYLPAHLMILCEKCDKFVKGRLPKGTVIGRVDIPWYLTEEKPKKHYVERNQTPRSFKG